MSMVAMYCRYSIYRDRFKGTDSWKTLSVSETPACNNQVLHLQMLVSNLVSCIF